MYSIVIKANNINSYNDYERDDAVCIIDTFNEITQGKIFKTIEDAKKYLITIKETMIEEVSYAYDFMKFNSNESIKILSDSNIDIDIKIVETEHIAIPEKVIDTNRYGIQKISRMGTNLINVKIYYKFNIVYKCKNYDILSIRYDNGNLYASCLLDKNGDFIYSPTLTNGKDFIKINKEDLLTDKDEEVYNEIMKLVADTLI